MVARYDYTYERNGTRNRFVMSELLVDWRHVEITERRRKQEFVQQIQTLVEEHRPVAECIRVALDNLNTHKAYAFYEFLLHRKLTVCSQNWRVTSHPSTAAGPTWPIEFSALATERLDRCLPDAVTLRSEVAAWDRTQNEDDSAIDWQFTPTMHASNSASSIQQITTEAALVGAKGAGTSGLPRKSAPKASCANYGR